MISDSTNVRVMADNIRKLKTEVENVVGNLDYSTTEQDTGVKWIDGKNIFRKVVSYTSPESGNYELSTPFDNIIYITGVTSSTEGSYQDFNKCHAYFGRSNKSGIVITPSAATYRNVNVVMIVYYTKPDPEPEPGNREPDEEPETKKLTKRKTTKGEN